MVVNKISDEYVSTVEAALTFEDRQRLLQLVVERVTVKDGRVQADSVTPSDGRDARSRTRRPEPVEGSSFVEASLDSGH